MAYLELYLLFTYTEEDWNRILVAILECSCKAKISFRKKDEGIRCSYDDYAYVLKINFLIMCFSELYFRWLRFDFGIEWTIIFRKYSF